jgi:hypothetical protein
MNIEKFNDCFLEKINNHITLTVSANFPPFTQRYNKVLRKILSNELVRNVNLFNKYVNALFNDYDLLVYESLLLKSIKRLITMICHERMGHHRSDLLDTYLHKLFLESINVNYYEYTIKARKLLEKLKDSDNLYLLHEFLDYPFCIFSLIQEFYHYSPFVYLRQKSLFDKSVEFMKSYKNIFYIRQSEYLKILVRRNLLEEILMLSVLVSSALNITDTALFFVESGKDYDKYTRRVFIIDDYILPILYNTFKTLGDLVENKIGIITNKLNKNDDLLRLSLLSLKRDVQSLVNILDFLGVKKELKVLAESVSLPIYSLV